MYRKSANIPCTKETLPRLKMSPNLLQYFCYGWFCFYFPFASTTLCICLNCYYYTFSIECHCFNLYSLMHFSWMTCKQISTFCMVTFIINLTSMHLSWYKNNEINFIRMYKLFIFNVSNSVTNSKIVQLCAVNVVHCFTRREATLTTYLVKIFFCGNFCVIDCWRRNFISEFVNDSHIPKYNILLTRSLKIIN